MNRCFADKETNKILATVWLRQDFLSCYVVYDSLWKVKGVDREKSAVSKELTQKFSDLWASRPSEKKKALTESKANKYLTLAYKNYLQKAWPPP